MGRGRGLELYTPMQKWNLPIMVITVIQKWPAYRGWWCILRLSACMSHLQEKAWCEKEIGVFEQVSRRVCSEG